MHTKVAKVVLSGEPAITSPLAFAKGLFVSQDFRKK
jgi:hypothetical protein